MRKTKTGPKIMVIQPQLGFFNAGIAEIIWPDKKTSTAKLANCFFQYDFGMYSGTTFYRLGETVKDQTVDSLIKIIHTELEQTLAPIFDAYKTLDDMNSFLQANMKHKSTDKIYSQHFEEIEYETAFNNFYFGLAAFFIYTGQKSRAESVLKRKYDFLMTPQSVSRPSVDLEGKQVVNITREVVDFQNDLPLIARLSKTYDLKVLK